MRITVSHKKTKEEAIRSVDEAFDHLIKSNLPSPVKVTDLNRQWNGSTMDFSLQAKMGFLGAPIKGSIWVTDKDVTIDADIPGILGALLPEGKLRTGLESKIKGLLT